VKSNAAEVLRRTGANTRAADPCSWDWPPCPPHFAVYDKYNDQAATVSEADDTWVLSVQGRASEYRFVEGADGLLQRRLTILTQADASPSSIEKFLRSLLKSWPLYKRLLVGGPEKASALWREEVADVDTAKAGKTVLKAACRASVGEWRPMHTAFIRSLDTYAKANLVSQRARLKRRETMLDGRTQARIVSTLYEAANNDSLPSKEVEGLAALALLFQFGVRPVQLLALKREHVRLVRDASGALACIVSFHAAKQPGGGEFELPRQLKPEWTSLLARCIAQGTAEGRNRIFASENLEQLWTAVRAGGRRFGFKVAFTAGALRHTAAQALADAGHDRDSIQRFLGQTNADSARVYFENSLRQGERINEALGVSKLYGSIVALAEKRFVSVDELLAASEDQQVGAVVGGRLVAGVGLCGSGQANCRFNPVTSCYGCSRFMPSLDRAAHEEAVAGMREQVLQYVDIESGRASPAYRQLTTALAGAQQAIAYIRDVEAKRAG
jgi:integrase